MTFNLLTDPFMPVRTRDGGTRVLTLTELPFAEDALEPDWPRPDFNAAAMELMIGIAALALQPQDADAWIDVWEQGPERWEERLREIAPAFELLGDGPRFLQHISDKTEREATEAEILIIDGASANSKNENKDLLSHRGRYSQFSARFAAMALYTLQAYSPSGGPGFMTSLRGGGPLTALIIPKAKVESSLWKKVWANTPCVGKLTDISHVCPWLKSETPHEKISQGNSQFHEIHAFFGMPRRIWLIENEGTCPISKEHGVVVTSFLQEKKGIDYDVWRHPLTPYHRRNEGGEFISVKPMYHRLRSLDWVSAVIGNPPLQIRPGIIDTAYSYRLQYFLRDADGHKPYVRVSGWNMQKATAVSWLFSEEPIYIFKNNDEAESSKDFARRLAYSTNEAANLTARAVKRAVIEKPKKEKQKNIYTDDDVNLSKGILEDVMDKVFDRCDAIFHEWIELALAGTPADELLQSWRVRLRQAALDAFDRAAPIPLMDPERALRVLSARQSLERAFGDRTKSKALKELIVEVAG